MLTPQQKKLLVFVNDYINKNGIAPSFDEMYLGIKLKSKSGIHRLLDALVERGFIRRLQNRARAIEVIRLPADMPQPDPQTRARSEIFPGIHLVYNPIVPENEVWVRNKEGKIFQILKVAS